MRPGPKKGQRLAGRQKGTPNKRTVELLQGLINHKCAPAKEIANLLLSPDLNAGEKMACWERLLPYIYPQWKAIDPEGYIAVAQVAGMLGAQASTFQSAMHRANVDPQTIGVVLESCRASSPSSH